MPDAPTPEMLKKMKFDQLSPNRSPSIAAHNVSSPVQPARNPRAATVEDEERQDAGIDDRDFAPGGDADYFAEEDEDGRFFGGGLTTEQKEILNIFDSVGTEGVDDVRGPILSVLNVINLIVSHRQTEALSITGVRKLLLRFERASNKNQDQRSKYPDDPTKYYHCSLYEQVNLISAFLGLSTQRLI